MKSEEMSLVTRSRHSWLFVVVAVVVAAALCCWCGWQVYRDCGAVPAVVPEAAVSDEAARAVRERIDEAVRARENLPEVISNAKDKAVADVDALDDAAVAERWNGILQRYRENRTAPEGLAAE